MARDGLHRARFCLTCKAIKKDGLRHKHDTGHEFRQLTEEEKQKMLEELQDSAPSSICPNLWEAAF